MLLSSSSEFCWGINIYWLLFCVLKNLCYDGKLFNFCYVRNVITLKLVIDWCQKCLFRCIVHVRTVFRNSINSFFSITLSNFLNLNPSHITHDYYFFRTLVFILITRQKIYIWRNIATKFLQCVIFRLLGCCKGQTKPCRKFYDKCELVGIIAVYSSCDRIVFHI